MEGNYVLHFGGQAVGKVQVTREGLYYRFQCRCRLSGDVVCKVVVRCGAGQESLGILAPEGDGFCLATRLPVKRFLEATPEFLVMPNRTAMTGKFVPICPEEPFTYLERLKNAYLSMQNGQIGAVIRETPGS